MSHEPEFCFLEIPAKLALCFDDRRRANMTSTSSSTCDVVWTSPQRPSCPTNQHYSTLFMWGSGHITVTQRIRTVTKVDRTSVGHSERVFCLSFTKVVYFIFLERLLTIDTDQRDNVLDLIMLIIKRWSEIFSSCLLWRDKSRVKQKTDVWVSVWWKD